MRRFLSYCLAVLFLASCAREEDLVQEWAGPVIELRFREDGDFATKADDVYQQSGENPYRENDLKWVDFFFYPDGNIQSPATYHIHKVLEQTTRLNATFRLELTTNQVNNLIFPVPTDTENTTVLALANVPESVLSSIDDTSYESLKQVTAETDFAAYSSTYNHRQSSFMMSGFANLTLAGRTQKVVAQGIVPLSRYACKLTVGIKTEDHVEIDTGRRDDGDIPVLEIWRPCIEEMKTYTVDVVNNVALGGNPSCTDGGVASPSFFDYRSNPMLFFENAGTDANPVYEQIFDQSGGYYNTYPMYMYPQRWVDGVSDGNQREPYIKLVLPWEREEDLAHGIKHAKKEFYYKILIPKDPRAGEYTNSFIRNNWYHYNIEVGMLGADTDDAAVVVNPIDFYIYYWQDKNMVIKHANIGNARYLSVDNQHYVLNNQTELDIRFTTSHPVSYIVNSAIRPYYGSVETDPAKSGVHVGDEVVEGGFLREDSEGHYYIEYDASGWFSMEGGAVKLNHPLNNNYTTSDFDYSPYYISVTIKHTDQSINSNYSKTIDIVQYPAVYITEEENSDPRVVDPSQGLPIAGDEVENANGAVWRNFAHNGYVFIDGQRIWRHKTGKNDNGEYGTIAKHLNSSWKPNDNNGTVRLQLEWLQWRTVHFSGGNRNRYTITVSVLPEGSRFVIGDPRTTTPETWNNGREAKSTASDSYLYYNWYDSDGDGIRDTEDNEYVTEFRPGPDLRTGEVRNLTNYYPAEDSDRTRYMLAPALRVSSRFGGVEFYNGFTKQSALFKCATYQEDGYPAGRWRLPTAAEIDFITTLTAKGNFVKLFGSGGWYWSANGAMKAGSNPSTTQTYALVRCVYDAWYWDAYNDRLAPEDRDTYYFGDFAR